MLTRRMPRRPGGFTLVELIVTMAVLGLLAMAVAPSVADWLRNTRVRGAAESMLAGLQRARSEALRSNETVTFWLVAGSDDRVVDDTCALSSAAGSWVVSRQDPVGACGTTPSPTTAPQVVESHAAGDNFAGIAVAASNAAAAAAECVRFNGFGRVVAADVLPADNCRTPSQIATIDVSHSAGSRRLRLVVSPSGSVRMCDRDTSGTDPRACP